jgi:hypothetical protein
MPIPVSPAFTALLNDKQERLIKKTFVVDPTDRTSLQTNIGTISQQQREGDSLVAADIILTFINDTGQLNSILTSKPSFFNKEGRITMEFASLPLEPLDRYKGFVVDANFYSEGVIPLCDIRLSCRFQFQLETPLGNSTVPLIFTAQNPADLAEALMQIAGLVPVVDYDPVSLAAYRTICSSLGFSVSAILEGDFLGNALSRIGLITDTLIVSDPSGRIFFQKFIPSVAPSPPVFVSDSTKGDFGSARIEINRDRLINKVQVFFGWNVGLEGPAFWSGSETKNNVMSQTDFGISSVIFQDTSVFHADSISAGAFAERLVVRRGDMPSVIRFLAQRGTVAPILIIGDLINITWSQVGYTLKPHFVYGINLNMVEDTCEVIAEDSTGVNANFFILDSASNGVLDQNVLF